MTGRESRAGGGMGDAKRVEIKLASFAATPRPWRGNKFMYVAFNGHEQMMTGFRNIFQVLVHL